MAVEKMQFSMPMAAGYEGFPFTAAQTKKEEVEAFVRARAEAAILKAKAEAAILKAKAEEEKKDAFLKAKVEVEKEAAFLKAKAEAAAETGEANYDSEQDDALYEKLYHGDYNLDEDPEIEARWNAFIEEEEEAHYPNIMYREYYPGEYTVDDSDDSDNEQDCYRRKLEEAGHVLV